MERHFFLVLGIALSLLSMAGAGAGEPSSKDVANLRNLAGCFEVAYGFVEDGAQDSWAESYGLGTVTEWVGFKKDESGDVTLPHVSITEDARAVAHWYEVWKFHSKARTWTQEVWSRSPGDENSELRYACTAPWTQNRWQCHAGKAPKPFRDSGAPFGFNRTDYDWLDRENILLVTDKGWVHNEHNKKMESSGLVVSYELGWITYRRIAEERCGVAIDQFSRPRNK